MNDDLDRLRRQNSLLREHVKRLLTVEQTLHVSQRSLERQVKRLDVLNRFAAEASRLSEPAAVLRRAAEAFYEVFPVDQCVGSLQRGGSLVPVMALGSEGHVAKGMIAGVCAAPSAAELSAAADIGSEAELHCRFPRLLQVVADTFGGPRSPAPGQAILLPIFGGSGELAATLLFRSLGERSFHEERAGPADLPFLQLLGQQTSAAIENASLLASLSESYLRLAEAQQELVKRERLSALGELTAVVAHEVRNPLAAMVNVISAMKRRAPAQGEQAALLGILSEEAFRLDQMVNDMLDFARPNAPQLRPEAMAELVRESAESALTALGPDAPRLTFQSAESPFFGQVDARMVRQAVVNLVLNAAQSVRAGGSVTVSLCQAVRDGAPVARIEVSDTGGGIPAQDLDRIFQPFFTTRAAGTGLGLALVKRFVEAHQGEVLVTSQLGRGSTFTLLLPLSQGQAMAAASARLVASAP